MQDEKKASPVLKWVLILSMTVVANLFINYAISSFYKAPEYEAFCPNRLEKTIPAYDSQEACLAVGGQWTANTDFDSRVPKGYCDPDFTCRQKYEDDRKVYDRNVFVVRVFVGLILLSLGFFLRLSETFSLGLSLAGLLSFVVGSVAYWSNMQEYVRVIVLGLALAFLIWIAVKKIRS
jgi:hypothetical protein